MHRSSPESYQGSERWEMLRLLRRLCLTTSADLIGRLCADTAQHSTIVRDWFNNMTARLEARIQATGHRDGPEAMVMATLSDPDRCADHLSPSLEALCKAWKLKQAQRFEALLWNLLSQHFKRKMDELDGFAGGHGTHRLRAHRRLEQLARQLTKARIDARPYPSLAELAADLAIEVRRLGLEKQLPSTPSKILDYLYASEAATAVTEDPWDEALILDQITSPETWVQLQQCLERLPESAQAALSLAVGLTEAPVFLDDQSFAIHYGANREAMRKRALRAREALLRCLFETEAASEM